MKQILKLSIVFTSYFLLQISCKEEFLEPKPLSFFAPENVYVDKSGFESGLVTLRKNLTTDFYNPTMMMNAEVTHCDIGVPTTADLNNDLTPSSSGIRMTFFTNAYQYIRNANVIISRIDNITWSKQEDRNAILAYAYFFRSYWYYRLINTYGDVPFIGKELKGAKLDFFTHSRWAILNKIQSDMEYAVQWLPEIAPIGNPTKYAGNHLLAKICLANTEFDKAITAATSVINGPFTLMTARFGSYVNDKNRNVIWDLHRHENKALSQNKEAILICVDRAEAPTAARTTGIYSMRLQIPTWWHTSVKDSK